MHQPATALRIQTKLFDCLKIKFGVCNAVVNTWVLIQGHTVTGYKLSQLVSCNYIQLFPTLKLY